MYAIGIYHEHLDLYPVVKNGETVAWFKTKDDCEMYIAIHTGATA